MRTLFIAPYSGLAEIVKKMDVEPDIELDVTIGNLEAGVRAALLAEKQGYELIISRGGTATMIQENVTIPVVHIDITGYDMLRVFTLIRGIKENVALVGFSNISQGAKTICNILEYDVKMVTITSREEVRGQLEQLKHQGFSVVIGDVVTVETALQIGLRGILITSGKEAFIDALEEGKRVYDLFRKVNNQFYYLRETFNATPFPMVLLNKDCKMVEKNLSFEQTIEQGDIVTSHSIAKQVKKVLNTERTQWTDVVNNNKRYNLQFFLVNKQQGIVGIIIHETAVEAQSKPIQITGDPVYTPIIGDSRQTKQLRTHVEQYGHVDGNVCLIGESGTGKHAIAEAMHFVRFGQNSPIITVEGKQLTSTTFELERLKQLLSTIEQGTIIFNQVDMLSKDTQDAARNILLDKNDQIKLISLATKPIDRLVWEPDVDKDLYQVLTEYTLHIPPLRERKEDIRALIDYFIAEFHTKNGSETVGIKREAADDLSQYEWPGNISQLKKVVRELSMTNTANYIERSQVKDFMGQYSTKEETIVSDHPIPLQGTLEEMEKEIIKRVLQEEGNNQTKAANRLGINRSTLWRKLQ